jgi:hypothetical protein
MVKSLRGVGTYSDRASHCESDSILEHVHVLISTTIPQCGTGIFT